jgi:phosphoglycolate phosphatase
LTERVLLFDLDGTLTDPKLGIVECMRYALDRLARPCPDEALLASFIGPPLRGAFSNLLETSNTEAIEEAMTIFRERYTHTGIYENYVYDGVPAMLERARNAASATFLATSKPRIFAQRILEHFGLSHHFTGVYGSELDGLYDNKVHLLEHLLAAEGIEPRATVMVGDRAADILAAKANGVGSIGVLWGYGSADELTSAGADRLCAMPGDLLSCLS